MKIGILTFYKAHNYGAVLQAVALRMVLERMGHDVYYIDYWPSYQAKLTEVSIYDVKGFIRQPILFLRKLLDYFLIKKRMRFFDSFINQQILPYCKSMESVFDMVVYGSDQIWRSYSSLGYDPVFFGKNKIKAIRHISYAASTDSFPKNKKDCYTISSLLSHLDAISVREQFLLDGLKQIGYNNVVLSLDPTLLLTMDIWKSKIPLGKRKCNNYILVYELHPGAFNESELQIMAERRGCEIKRIYGHAFFSLDKEKDTSCGPLEFLNYIYYADFVLTSSYHGLAFAIIFHKQFLCSMPYNPYRAQTLLRSIGCIERLLSIQEEMRSDYPELNYKEIDKRLEDLRYNSTKYLSENISLCIV